MLRTVRVPVASRVCYHAPGTSTAARKGHEQIFPKAFKTLTALTMTGRLARWKTLLPLGFVMLSLLALVLVPMWTQQQTEALRDEMIRVAKPARILLTEIQLTL